MNREPDFELSADMRLLELQRRALGLAAPERTNWETHIGNDSPPFGGIDDEQIAAQSAVLTVETAANPPGDVIPGAIVTLSLSVANEGAAPSSDIRVSVPLPGGAVYRPGTMLQDGRPLYDERAEAFFGEGLEIAAIAPGRRATFVWKLAVRLGTKPLVIAPQVHATGSAVIGARPLTVSRKEQATTAFGGELSRADAALYEPKPLIPVEIPASELPIYELDAEEEIEAEAAQAALSPMVPPKAQPAEPPVAPAPTAPPPVVVEPPAEPPAEPRRAEPPAVAQAAPVERAPVAEPTPVVEPVPAPVEAVAPAPPIAPVPAREAVELYGRFDRTTLVFFERTFSGSKPPTILQHCIFGSALACASDARGNDPAGLKRHLDAQSQVLHRIVLHEKLGKKEPIAEYAGEFVATLGELKAAPIEPATMRSTNETLVLRAELSDPTLGVIRKIEDERARWDFVKARQLTLALQAQQVDLADEGKRAAIENALRAYAQASMTVLQKLFVRIRIDRTTGLLFQTEPTLDASARALLAAFSAAIER